MLTHSAWVASIRALGFEIPCPFRSGEEVADGRLRLKAARKLGITEIPVIPCDELTPAQVKEFRLMVNRSVTCPTEGRAEDPSLTGHYANR